MHALMLVRCSYVLALFACMSESKVLELGIIVHSVIIGMSLGASENPSTIRPLVAALTFHQFFEGIGLGGCIVQVCTVQGQEYGSGMFYMSMHTSV